MGAIGVGLLILVHISFMWDKVVGINYELTYQSRTLKQIIINITWLSVYIMYICILFEAILLISKTHTGRLFISIHIIY